MSSQNLDLKNKDQVTQVFSEFLPLVQQHKLKELLDKTLDLLPQLNIMIDDKIIGLDVDTPSDGIVIRVYSMHGMKIVIRIWKSGYITRWIEGISNCETYCQ